MVEFFDPVQNINLSYHIDEKLLKKWNKLKDSKLEKKDEDRVYIVDGRERMGKSLFTFQQAKYLDPTFNLNRICFTPEEFLDQIRNAPRGSVIVFDEAFRGLSSKASQSKVNKRIVQAMMEMGQRNLIVFIVLPTFFLLELYPAVLRSEALFHIYKDKKSGKRCFKVYNYMKKSSLYKFGKAKGFSYSRPKIKRRGYFYNKYPIEEQSYRDKKLKALRESDQVKAFEEEVKIQTHTAALGILIKALRSPSDELKRRIADGKISYPFLSQLCSELGFYRSKDTWKNFETTGVEMVNSGKVANNEISETETPENDDNDDNALIISAI